MTDFENLSDVEVVKAFRQMNDQALHESAVRMAEKERRITLSLLRHLNEIERRHLFSKFSVSSMHGYCVKELKMCGGTAGRRVSAARLLKELPVVEEKILSGSVNLTAVAQAGVFFRKEAKIGHKFSIEEKKELVFELENKSDLQVEKILISRSEQPEIHFKEKMVRKTETKTEITLQLDDETMEAINRLKEIWSNSMPNAKLADVIKRAAKEAVVQNEKKKPKQNPVPDLSDAEISRQVWRRDQSQCTFEDPRTGDRCAARHFIEEDHVIPEAMGGEYTVENIRLRCRAHNQRHAINCYGAKKMKSHLPTMRA